MLEIRPTHLKPAREFVGKYHRHNIPPVGGKFAISCFEGERLCGVAICGRPTARKLDDGATLEIYRNCTDGTRNACTKLYGACVRIARDMGYKKVITYTLESENGASLRVYEGTSGASPVRKHRAYLRISDRRHGGGRAEREVDYMAACEARRAGLLARFLYAFGYRIGGDAWRENRRPRLR